MTHPKELSSVDHQLYSNINENEVEDLELPFSHSMINPWNGELEEISLSKDVEVITEENKVRVYVVIECKIMFYFGPPTLVEGGP